MALGEFTKQIAQQALLSATTKDPAPAPPPAPPQTENLAAVLLGQVNAMQKALKDDEELLITFQNGAERIRVMEIFTPARQMAVLSGTDPEGRARREAAPGGAGYSEAERVVAPASWPVQADHSAAERFQRVRTRVSRS
jgi:hypothetical protein